MDGTADFASLGRSMERFSGEFETAKAERATSETLIASAEYELEQLKKTFASARLDTVPEARRGDGAPAAFARKLRNPENWDDPDWQVALGLAR